MIGVNTAEAAQAASLFCVDCRLFSLVLVSQHLRSIQAMRTRRKASDPNDPSKLEGSDTATAKAPKQKAKSKMQKAKSKKQAQTILTNRLK